MAIIAGNGELQERAVFKRVSFAAAIADALRKRDVPDPTASLAAELGARAFYQAYEEWADLTNQQTLTGLARRALEELRAAAVRLDALGDAARKRPVMLSGGAGLVSTAADYHRFTQMLLHRADSPAGELDGTRLLSPRTVSYMARNHLPGGLDLETFGRPLYAESPFRGVGFGLGFAVVTDPAAGKIICSEGELSWGGAASTTFWIDPHEELTVSFFTQLLPSSAHPIRPQLRQLVYQALVR